ncbi:MAG: Trk system potassium transporter TrkA [Planctomycetota bacterium]|nr:MAG: Trk system potassium transporter TrkA [Planctomycetota bacterium]
MRVLIAGAGTIGYHLARSLAAEGQDVVVIDPRSERLGQLENSIDCQLIHGRATSPTLLEQANIRSVDLVIAVTESDSTNMAICRLADFYRVPEKMARVRDLELAHPDCIVPSEHFGIDHIISPELLTVEHIERLVLSSGASEALDFEHGRIALRGLVVGEDSDMAGETIAAIKQRIPGAWLLAAIRRGQRMFIPSGTDTLRLGDTVYIIASPQVAERILPAFVDSVREVRSALIFGGGVAGRELARRLTGHLRRVVLIEPDEGLAQLAAEELDSLGVEVLHGSALDEDLLLRGGIDRADAFVGISRSDENNFMGALLFRKLGTGGTPIVVISQPHYVEVLESVDIDLAINPRLLAVNAILRHLRGGALLSVARLRDEDAEIVEFKLSRRCPVLNIPLKDVSLPRGSLITAVLRGHDLHIPDGAFRLQHDDRVLLFVETSSSTAIRGIMR